MIFVVWIWQRDQFQWLSSFTTESLAEAVMLQQRWEYEFGHPTCVAGYA